MFKVLLSGLVAALLLAATPGPLTAPDVAAFAQLGQFHAPQGTVFSVVQVRFVLNAAPVRFGPRMFYMKVGKQTTGISEATFLEESACDELGLLRSGARVTCIVVFEAPSTLTTGILLFKTSDARGKPVTFTTPFKVTRRD